MGKRATPTAESRAVPPTRQRHDRCSRRNVRRSRAAPRSGDADHSGTCRWCHVIGRALSRYTSIAGFPRDDRAGYRQAGSSSARHPCAVGAAALKHRKSAEGSSGEARSVEYGVGWM